MVIQSKILTTKTRTIGRLSDGSDRCEVTETIWTVAITDDSRTYQLTFIQDVEPTEAEIQNKYQSGEYIDLTSDKDLISQLQEQIAQTQTDNLTALEALAEVYEMVLALQTPTT